MSHHPQKPFNIREIYKIQFENFIKTPKFVAPSKIETLAFGTSTLYFQYKFEDITAMKEFNDTSNEELRLEFYEKVREKCWKEEKFVEDIQNGLKSENFKDLTIKIGEEKFEAHKVILAARSPTLAEMIKNNRDADELILEDIEVEVFKIILDYIYDDKMPNLFTKNLTEIFEAADKFKLKELKDEVGILLGELTNRENVYEMMKLASKHDHEELKRKAFEEVKNIFPCRHLKDDLINDLEMLKELIEAKKEYEEKMREIQKNFDEVLAKVE